MPKRGQRELSKSTCTLTNYAVLHTQKKTEEIRVNIAPLMVKSLSFSQL